MKLCTHTHLTGFFHIYCGFLKLKNTLFWKWYFFYKWFSNFFEIFKILIIRDCSLIEAFIHNLLLKTHCFYFSNCLRGNVSRKPLFRTKNGKTWRHSDVIYGRIKPSELSFCQDVSNWSLGGYWKFGDDPYETSGDIAEKREGGKEKVPPVGRGLRYTIGIFYYMRVSGKKNLGKTSTWLFTSVYRRLGYQAPSCDIRVLLWNMSTANSLSHFLLLSALLAAWCDSGHPTPSWLFSTFPVTGTIFGYWESSWPLDALAVLGSPVKFSSASVIGALLSNRCRLATQRPSGDEVHSAHILLATRSPHTARRFSSLAARRIPICSLLSLVFGTLPAMQCSLPPEHSASWMSWQVFL